MPTNTKETNLALIQRFSKTKKGRHRILQELEKSLQLRKYYRGGEVSLCRGIEIYGLLHTLAIMSYKGERIPEDLQPVIEEAMRNLFANPKLYKSCDGERPTIWEHLEDDPV